MTDLQNAIDNWNEGLWQPEYKELIHDAARLVANPNKTEVRKFLNGHGIYPYDLTKFVNEFVAAALTGDTDG